jgi:hypothetical protein
MDNILFVPVELKIIEGIRRKAWPTTKVIGEIQIAFELASMKNGKLTTG